MDIVLDCCKAIEKGVEGWKAYLLRGRCLLKLCLYDAALKDFETVKIKKSETNFKIIEDTQALQKQWEEKGHYEVLDVEQTATKAEIMKSFKGLSMMFYPDRHRDKPDFIQNAFEEKYKKVVNAKLVLVNEQNRKEYDEELRQNCSQQNEDGQWGECNAWERNGRWRYHQEPPRQGQGHWNQGRQNYHEKPEWEQRRQRNGHQYYC
ncbi:dnaJ homolog subfamily C member 7-like [Palaemon carinicauda]|uniref:dnaJ homolog subfamily C member 7-like n=1 Tax=Palaemon carinicauda TaxID=392227 RepID=UPI0035B593F1